jgi:hypothetical protein
MDHRDLPKGLPEMTKRQLIDEIITINPTVQPGFLAGFQDAALGEYLTHLQVVKAPLLTGDAARYRKYFAKSAMRAAHAAVAPIDAVTDAAPREQAAPCEQAPRASDGTSLQSDATDADSAMADASATAAAAATSVTLTDLPSSEDVADVVWQDDQPLAAGEAAQVEESPAPRELATADDLSAIAVSPEADCDSPQFDADAPETAVAQQDDDGEAQTQLASVAAKLDAQKNETPFAGSSAETDSYLF